mmetsp:Transcript_89334/g.251505  ORF Transcript_89334/g.251505 Transcript_89334/m.251505 type:complete len:322 (+) Transcript_89334:930-1895(+)
MCGEVSVPRPNRVQARDMGTCALFRGSEVQPKCSQHLQNREEWESLPVENLIHGFLFRPVPRLDKHLVLLLHPMRLFRQLLLLQRGLAFRLPALRRRHAPLKKVMRIFLWRLAIAWKLRLPMFGRGAVAPGGFFFLCFQGGLRKRRELAELAHPRRLDDFLLHCGRKLVSRHVLKASGTEPVGSEVERATARVLCPLQHPRRQWPIIPLRVQSGPGHRVRHVASTRWHGGRLPQSSVGQDDLPMVAAGPRSSSRSHIRRRWPHLDPHAPVPSRRQCAERSRPEGSVRGVDILRVLGSLRHRHLALSPRARRSRTAPKKRVP